jgi:hypothetical protein
MLYVIPIAEETLDLIQVLNSGVRPTIEDEATCYVYMGENEHAEIMTEDHLRTIYSDSDLTTFTIGTISK